MPGIFTTQRLQDLNPNQKAFFITQLNNIFNFKEKIFVQISSLCLSSRFKNYYYFFKKYGQFRCLHRWLLSSGRKEVGRIPGIIFQNALCSLFCFHRGILSQQAWDWHGANILKSICPPSSVWQMSKHMLQQPMGKAMYTLELGTS